MTLKARLLRDIATSGPMNLARYMQHCLLDPDHGYYTSKTPFGAEGDFTTAPEISQMFGELLGLALVQNWIDQGAPKDIMLVELGPGRGTLMADIIRATKAVPGFNPSVHLIEASPKLREAQTELLGAQISFHDSVATLPDAPMLLIANEFFDALPIRQFERETSGWSERVISANGEMLAMGKIPAAGPHDRLADTKPGDIVETCPQAAPIIEDISQRINTFGGAAIIVDYGDWRSLGDTFQAVRGHQTVDPLDEPGTADLTAHVDFEALSLAASCTVTTMITQGVLLERLGITARAARLAEALEGKVLENHLAAHRRLTHPSEMGSLFKAIALYPDGAMPPAGFAP